MKQKLLKIPVLGKLLRGGSALIHAGSRFDALFRRVEQCEAQLRDMTARADRAEISLRKMRDKLAQMENVETWYLKRVVQRLCGDHSGLEELNQALSIHPTVWGDPARLHIAASAAVFPCFFNVNSGSITIGENTFAGSGVSLLAGTHDARLRGFARRDAEIPEGCDIVIGNGVWLASGCTVLGPCTIGDDAVIAAGAVVTPGTHVPPGCVFGGVPAKKLRDLELGPQCLAQDPHALELLKKWSGVFFTRGWSNRQRIANLDLPVYEKLEAEAGLLICDRAYDLHYGLEGAQTASLILESAQEKREYALSGARGSLRVQMPGIDGEAGEVRVRVEPPEARLYMALNRTETV